MGFPHVAQVARIGRIRELKGGRQEVETVWIITSLTAAQADLARLIELARQYWCIENGTHYPLDVNAGEDRYRVRHPVAATVPGILRRAVQGEARAGSPSTPRAGSHLPNLLLQNEPPHRSNRPVLEPPHPTLERP